MTRTEDEIVRAHDLLSEIVLNPVLREAARRADVLTEIVSYLHVLCWALHHDHNMAFAENLRMIEAMLERLGLKLTKHKETLH